MMIKDKPTAGHDRRKIRPSCCTFRFVAVGDERNNKGKRPAQATQIGQKEQTCAASALTAPPPLTEAPLWVGQCSNGSSRDGACRTLIGCAARPARIYTSREEAQQQQPLEKKEKREKRPLLPSSCKRSGKPPKDRDDNKTQ